MASSTYFSAVSNPPEVDVHDTMADYSWLQDTTGEEPMITFEEPLDSAITPMSMADTDELGDRRRKS